MLPIMIPGRPAAQRSHDQQINLIFTNASKKHLVGPADLVGKVNPNGLGQSLVLGLLQLVVQRLLSVSEDAPVVIAPASSGRHVSQSW